MPAKLLIIALDAAEPLLVKKWASMGKLPTLAKILNQKNGVAIENFSGFGNGAYWPSINTGVDPSHHGRCYRAQVVPPDYTIEPFLEDRDMKVPPFWKGLEDKGYEVAIIDPVETGMGMLSKGVEIVRWIVHGRTGPAASSPSDAVEQLISRYGDDPCDGNADALLKAGVSLENLTDMMLQRIDTKNRAMLELLDERHWDLVFVTYGEPHDIGHLAWHVHNELEKNDSPSATEKNPIAQCYQALDASIAKLMRSVADDGQTIILMGPGIEDNISGNTLLADILRGVQGQKRRAAVNPLAHISRFLAQSQLVPESIRKKTKQAKRLTRSKLRGASGKRFYCVPHNDNSGAIRINVAGREPNGVVSKGQAYDDACAEISQKLLAIKDASGKAPIVSNVIKLHDVYSGPELDQLPDLLIVWNRKADLSKISSPLIGVIKNRKDTIRSGDHSSRGLLLSDHPISVGTETTLAPSEVTAILVEALQRLDAHEGIKTAG